MTTRGYSWVIRRRKRRIELNNNNCIVTVGIETFNLKKTLLGMNFYRFVLCVLYDTYIRFFLNMTLI